MLRAIVFGGFEGKLSVINPKEYKIQEIKSYASIVDILEHATHLIVSCRSGGKRGSL